MKYAAGKPPITSSAVNLTIPFGDLSRSPFRSGMGRHVEVNCATPMVAQHYEANSRRRVTVDTTRKSVETNCLT